MQQNAYHDVDSYCSLEKQYLMAKIILQWYDLAGEVIDYGVSIGKIEVMGIKGAMARMKYVPSEEFEKQYDKMVKEMKDEFEALKRKETESA